MEYTYTYKSDVYCGCPETITPESYYKKHVYEVCEVLLDGYGFEKMKANLLCTDNYYTSLPLSDLCERNQISLIGTVKSNRKGFDKKMLDVRDRSVNSSIVWFEKTNKTKSITSTCVQTSKGKKALLIFSSYKGLSTLGVSTDEKKKTALNRVYNYCKIGTDVSGKNKVMIL